MPQRPTALRRSSISVVAAIAVACSAIAGALAGANPPASSGAGPSALDRVTVGDAALVTARQPRPQAAPAIDAFDASNVNLGLTLVASGFVSPVLVTNAGDGSGRLFVVEQAGRVRIIAGKTTFATPFLDLRGLISTGGERGLLGLAFHPNFPATPYVYVNLTDLKGDTAIYRYSVGSNPNVAIRTTGKRILTIKQPYANHNGGDIAFGPDGYLYIGTGDGGSGGDPGNRAQSLNSLLGKMLRIDVNGSTGTRPYRIPASNPFVNRTGLDEIWSRGLRNPWRWSFDRLTDQLWIGDVGQGRFEEIDRSNPLTSHGAGWAANYGWRILEGRTCFNPATGCSSAAMVSPIVVYPHVASGTENCSVTGGFVYRGHLYPVLAGGYVYGDFCSGRMWVVSAASGAVASPTLVRDATATPKLAISSFGESDSGEVYVTDLSGGRVYRITATAKP